MYCTKCGSAVSEGGAFCGACGQPVAGSPAAAAAASFPGGTSAPPQTIQPYAAPPGAAPVAAYGFVALPSPFAGFWLRLVAYIIDLFLLVFGFCVVVLFGAVIVGVGVFRNTFENADSPDEFFTGTLIAGIVLGIVILIVGVWLYYAAMESSIHQGTLGKIALGLFVTDLQGKRITFGRASGRFFARIITKLIPLGLGFVMAGFTEKKQALHDMIASCLVLRKN